MTKNIDLFLENMMNKKVSSNKFTFGVKRLDVAFLSCYELYMSLPKNE